MKIMHLADLHIGKNINGFSMIDDQDYILKEILKIIDENNVDTVMMAGDIYDKSIPATEAINLFNDFLVELASRHLNVLVISGNHDSADRLAFANKLIAKTGVYIANVYDGDVKPITIDGINFYLLPFIKPVNVKRFFPEEEINSYTDMMRVAIEHMDVDFKQTNILIAHQFITGASTSDSEVSVGGSDNIDADVFEGFDYVALGHLHAPQHILKDTIRYSGTPLKYSFSESNQIKSATIIELTCKDDLKISTIPLSPKRDFRTIKGSYEEIVYKPNYEKTNTDDYIKIVLTDEEDIPNVIGILRNIYPNIISLEYDNTRTRNNCVLTEVEDIENKSEIELLEEFYLKQNGKPMDDTQREYSRELFEKIKEQLL